MFVDKICRSSLKGNAAYFFALVLLPLLTAIAPGQEWTRFRGPNGTGISQVKSIPATITDADVRWKIELPGSGHSSPVLWGERLFVTCSDSRSGGMSVICLGANDGKVQWKQDFELPPFPEHRYNSYASSTPAVDAERLYVVWNEPEHYFLAALDHTGKKLWQRDFGPFVSAHGCGTSPIVYDGKVILGNFQDDPQFVEGPTPDHRTGQSSILAVDCKTGKTVWQAPRRSTVVSYSTPCVYEGKGKQAAVIFNSQSHGISALDPATGKVLWDYDKAFDKRSVSSPMLAGEIILGSCGNGGGGNSITAIKPGDATSGRQPELAYRLKKSMPYVPTGVVMDNLAWLWSDGGILTCVTAATGEIRYQERVGGNYFGSPIWADGRLYCVSVTGELVVVQAKDEFHVICRYPLNELCRSTPAAAQGSLFVRTEKHLWSFTNAKNASVP